MKIGGRIVSNNGSIGRISVFLFIFILIATAGAQRDPHVTRDLYPYARFKSTMAAIIVVLVVSLFFIGFFSVYIRYCTGTPTPSPTIDFRRAFPFRHEEIDDDDVSAARGGGLDSSVIEAFPIISYAQVKDRQIGKQALECAVCLNEFEKMETLRLLPKCSHVFHPECIDKWLQSNVTCPVCRADLIPRPDDKPTWSADTPPNFESESRNSEIVIHVSGEDANRSSDESSRPSRSSSPRLPGIFGVGKFRSHSTGHLIQPVENLERFTLRLPADARKEVLDRIVPGHVTSNRRIDMLDRDVKSDRWVVSMDGPEAGEGSSQERTVDKTMIQIHVSDRPPV